MSGGIIASGGGGGAEVTTDLVQDYSQTIGDYTTPTTATSSSQNPTSSTKNTFDSPSDNGNDNNSSTYLEISQTNHNVWQVIHTYQESEVRYVSSVTFELDKKRDSGSSTNQWLFAYSADNVNWTNIYNGILTASHVSSWTNETGTCTVNANAKYFRYSMWGKNSNTYLRLKKHSLVYDAYNDPESNVYADDTSNKWKSDSETNPNIYVDMGSSSTVSHIAVYPHSDTTETEIKIQTSTNASDWTDQRKILVSNLTNGQWNYIRFNPVTARYVRVYGNSGSSKVMAINEIKVIDGQTDNDILFNHAHKSISATDTSLALDGTET